MKRVFLTTVFVVMGLGLIHSQTWFEDNNTRLEAIIRQYDYQRYNTITHEYVLPINGKTKLASSEWEIRTEIYPVSQAADAVDVEMRFYCISGSLQQASLSAAMLISHWSKENYVLMPSVAYHGNRFESRKIAYSPKLNDIRDIGIHQPAIVSDVLRLNIHDGYSRIQDRSGAFATPCVGFQSPETRKGWIMLTEYGNSLGDYGISIEETRDRKQATICITSPIVRERNVYMICNSGVASWDVPKDFHAGDSVCIRFRLFGFEARQIRHLYNRYAAVRKSFQAGTLRDKLPFSYCQTIQEKKFNAFNFVSEHGYYSVGMRENFLQDWQIGWTGGMISTYPLLYFGSDQTRNHVIRNFDWLFNNGISPSGFYWDAGEKGTVWHGGDIRKPHCVNWHLIRKSGDAIYYIIKQLMLMERLNIPVKEVWKQRNREVCDAFVNLWNKNHQFGQFVNSQTGEIMVGGSSSGASAIGGLALASIYYNHPGYLQVAKEAAEYMYQNFTARGITCGGPGDAMQNPDSESSYAIVESFALLFETTREPQWLVYAEDAAKQFSTWVVTGNYPFPETSLFGKAGIQSMGAVYANTQNKHGAPAICTASGVGLLRLYRATGNDFYRELLQDIAHNAPQYLPCPENPMPGVKEGWVCERVNMTDWEGTDRIGEIIGLSTWAETGLMLTTMEIPGVYIRTDKGTVTTFDNVRATIIKQTAKEMQVKLFNPTAVPAGVTWLAEGKEAAERPLKENYLLDVPFVNLKSGEYKILKIKL